MWRLCCSAANDFVPFRLWSFAVGYDGLTIGVRPLNYAMRILQASSHKKGQLELPFNLACTTGTS